MASKNSYDFSCPQFVDFCSGVEGSSNDDIWFGENLSTPKNRLNSEEFAELIRNVPSKFDYNINLRTPINKPLFVRKFCPTNTTDSEKLSKKNPLTKRYSKSDGALNLLENGAKTKRANGFFPLVRPKKSVSDGDLRQKKKIYPTTPMCLKRTLSKAKIKKIKTTEELELEKIAKLREQTFKHLRSNENAMRKLKIKQTCGMQKHFVGTEMKEKTVPVKSKKIVADHKAVLEKINVYMRKVDSQIPTKEPPVVDVQKVLKVNCFNKKRPFSCSNFSATPWNQAGPSRLHETKTDTDEAVIKAIPVKRYEGHSGLLFPTNTERKCYKPFYFQSRTKELGLKSALRTDSKGNETRRMTQFSSTTRTARFKDNKENVSPINSNYNTKLGRPTTRHNNQEKPE